MKKTALFIFLIFFILASCNTTEKRKESYAETKIIFRNNELIVEIASTKKEMSKGLMERESLDKNNGMLFMYDKDCIPGFWMKNTTIPLSVAFIDNDKTIIQIEELTPLSLTPVSPYKSIKFALEVNRGWFEKNDIIIGDSFSFVESHGLTPVAPQTSTR